jgi:DNA-binding beta-propeller fold protein YncE
MGIIFFLFPIFAVLQKTYSLVSEMHKRASQSLSASAQMTDSIGTTIPLDTAWLVGIIPLDFVPREIAISHDEKTLFVAHANGQAVSVIDIATNSITRQIHRTGAGNITVSPDGAKLYTVGTTCCYVIDTYSHEVIDTIPSAGVNRIVCSPNGRFLGLSFEYSPDGLIRLVDRYDYSCENDFDLGTRADTSLVLAISADSALVYTSVRGNSEDSRRVSVIDTTDYSQIDIPGFREPQSMVTSQDANVFYVGGRNGVYFVDAATHTLFRIVELGMPGYPVEVIGVTPDGHHVYAMHGCEGDLYRIDTYDYKATCVASLPSASGSVLSADGTRLYTTHSDLQWISLYAL